MNKFLLLLLSFILTQLANAQPDPCGPNPAMTSFCADACVICDIDGYTGVNDLTAQGQAFGEFCTTQHNNMQYIAFVAGSVDLTIQVDVSNCVGGAGSLEVGFFESIDCQNFKAITICDTNIEAGESQTFTNLEPLVIGQHYYLIIDGSGGTNCNWTFNVLQGTTAVLPLTTSGIISGPTETCPDMPVLFNTTGQVGAAIYNWTVDGFSQSGISAQKELTFATDGVYEVCVTASNVCDEAPPSCTSIIVRTPETLNVNERLCEGDCVVYNNIDFCNTGSFQEIVTLPNGCDSTINIDILVLPVASVDVALWICRGESFFIGTEAYTETGTYSSTILTVDECDSIVNLDLRVIECEIEGSSDEVPVICNGTTTGTLIFSIDQGEPPLTFTYTNIFDPNITGTGTTDILVDNQIPGVPAGRYTIYVSDDFGNDVVIPALVTEPAVLQVDMVPSDYDGFNVSCNIDNQGGDSDGTLTAEMLGGVAPYSYEWSDGQTTQTATGLTYVEYSVTVTDDVGCTLEASYLMTGPPAIVPNPIFSNPSCDGFESGSVSVSITEGGFGPYEYALNDSINFSVDTIWNGLIEGVYRIWIRDAHGCVVWVESEITAPQIPVVDFPADTTIFLGDSIRLTPNVNAIDIINIEWNNLSTLSCADCLDPIASPVNDTEYVLTVTSKDDCTASNFINVTVEKRRRIYVSNMFSPNDDFNNDIFLINGGPEVDEVLTFNVYDRWGNLLFNQKNFPVNDPLYGWDGYTKDIKVNPGVYVWSAEILFIDNESLHYSGSISLIR